MSERYPGYVPTPSGRSPTFNPARASMPTSVGYSSMYAGDMHVMPSASQRHYATPRGYSTSTTASGVPTTTRTYAVTQDPRASSKTRDGSRTRRSTLDSTSRPPVIITTTHLDRPHGSSSQSAHPRSGSPVRDEYRASDGQVYSQPASSIRSRSTARPYYTSSGDDYARYRDRADSHLTSRDLEAYRNSRPSVVYPSDPRHSTAAIDYGDEGYQYTNAGELVRYDLDQSKPSRSRKHERHDSVDTGYYRPNVDYDLDRRNLNVNTSHDLNRTHNASGRQHEGRGGPPPSTRGFDKINRGYDSRDVPPAAPVPPSPTTAAAQLEVPGGSGSSRRPRPLSLHQDGGLRSSHHDEFYRSREDERAMRDLRDGERDRDLERRSDHPRFHDDSVAARGFGIRTDLLNPPEGAKERLREARSDDPRKTSDEDVLYGAERDRESGRWNRHDPIDDRRDRRQAKRESDEESQDQDRSRTRETVASGLGAVVTAAGLAASSKSGDQKDQVSPGPRRRRSPPEDRSTRREEILGQDPRQSFERISQPVREKEPAREREPLREKEPLREQDHIHERIPPPEREVFLNKEPLREPEPIREKESLRDREAAAVKEPREPRADLDREPARERPREKQPVREEIHEEGSFERRRPEPASGAKGDPARLTGSDSDDTKKPYRRGRPSHGFDPNDASDLKQLKEQLASMEISDRRQEKEPDRPALKEKSRARSPSPSKERLPDGSSRDSSREKSHDESRGREIVAPASDTRQVRLVSPPKDKSDGKPLKGILKQPKVSFPEEANPVREGVAPHKEDKKLKEAPPGARWTKINRKIVNPEALTIGKERFEVRDDFVIVLRVLSKEEIQAYAAATQVLRERRRNKYEGDNEGDTERAKEREGERDEGDKEDRHRHRRRRGSEEEESDDKERERNRDRDRDRDRDRERDRDRDRDRERERERDKERDRDRERERERERDRPRDRERDRDYERDSDRRRHYRREEPVEYESRPREDHHHHHHHNNHRSFRDRERELEAKD